MLDNLTDGSVPNGSTADGCVSFSSASARPTRSAILARIAAYTGARASVRARAHDLDEQGRGRLSPLRGQSVGARGSRTSMATSLIDFCLGDTGAMAGHSPKPMVDAVIEQIAEQRRRDDDDADRRRGLGRDRADAPLRPAFLELLADRHRRQPVGDPARSRDHRASEDPVQQLLLPRHRRRVADRRRPRRPRSQPRGQRRRAVRCHDDQPGRRVQRPRRASSASWPTATWRRCSWSRR